MHLRSQRLKILFLASWYPSLTHRTLGNFVQRHAEAVATRHDVHVLYVSALPEIRGYEIHDDKIAGVGSSIVYYRKGIFDYFRRMIAFRKGIRHIQKEGFFSFDLVHLNVIWPQGWQALYLKWKYGLPYIITEHWTGYDSSERPHPGRKVERLSKLVAANASSICPVSDNLGESMRSFGLKGKYVTVPNVVDTHLFHLSEKERSVTHFIHVSSLNEDQKNISGILRAWKKATELSNSIHLDIGGDGPVEHVRDLSASMSIPSASISFFGEQPWEKIAEMMSVSHCLLLFSNYENLPCVITEALSSGLPVISTRTGGISEHIHPERGILIEKRDETALTKAILEVARNPEYFQSHELRKYATDHFSPEAVADQFSEVYFDVLQSTSTRSDKI